MTVEDGEIKGGGSATCAATSGRLLRSMSLGAGQKRTSGDTPAPAETGSPEVNCQKCGVGGGGGGGGGGFVENRSGVT